VLLIDDIITDEINQPKLTQERMLLVTKLSTVPGKRILVLLLVLVLLAAMSFLAGEAVVAEEPPEIELSDTRVTAGGRVATFGDVDTGFAVFGGLGVPLSEDVLMVAQYERYFAEDLGLNAVSADFIYELAQVVREEFEVLRFYAKGNLGYYFGSLEERDFSGMGIKAGVGAEAEIIAGFGLGADLAFRNLDISDEEDEDINLAGLEAGLQLFYGFEF